MHLKTSKLFVGWYSIMKNFTNFTFQLWIGKIVKRGMNDSENEFHWNTSVRLAGKFGLVRSERTRQFWLIRPMREGFFEVWNVRNKFPVVRSNTVVLWTDMQMLQKLHWWFLEDEIGSENSIVVKWYKLKTRWKLAIFCSDKCIAMSSHMFKCRSL